MKAVANYKNDNVLKALVNDITVATKKAHRDAKKAAAAMEAAKNKACARHQKAWQKLADELIRRKAIPDTFTLDNGALKKDPITKDIYLMTNEEAANSTPSVPDGLKEIIERVTAHLAKGCEDPLKHAKDLAVQ